jgi:hypothetical protein
LINNNVINNNKKKRISLIWPWQSKSI